MPPVPLTAGPQPGPEELLVFAQADSEEFLKGESAEGWELLARWRVWLVHWGRFQDELAAGAGPPGPEDPLAVGRKSGIQDLGDCTGFRG